MPFAEDKIAALLLRRLAKEIDPGECRELEGWVNESIGNRQTIEELSKPANLINKLRDFYNNLPGEPSAGDTTPGAQRSNHSESNDTVFFKTGLRTRRPYFPHAGKK